MQNTTIASKLRGGGGRFTSAQDKDFWHTFLENIKRGDFLKSFSIAGARPSPEFVNSLTLINKFCPLTKREGERHKAYWVTRFAELNGSLCILKGEGNREPFTPHPSRFISKKAAFTLAEVLITLGIIGVVAAMTLPALIQNNKETELTTRAKKTYSEINQAIKLYEAKSGTPGDIRGLFEAKNGTPDSGQLAEDFAKYFSGAKVCKSKTDKGCSQFFYSIEYATPFVDSEGNYTAHSSNNPKIILKDGAVLGIFQYNYCGEVRTSNKYDEYGRPLTNPDGSPQTLTWSTACAYIYFDTNGLKRPNKYGMDAFQLKVMPEKLIFGDTRTGGESLKSLLTYGKLKYTNYKVGDKMEF